MNWMETLGLTLLHFLWQGLLIGMVAAGVNLALRRASANARYLAACGAMTLMGCTAVATFVWLSRPLAVTGGEAVSAIVSTTIVFSGTAGAQAVPQSWTRALPWLDYLWFAGVCALAVRSALSWMAAQRLRNSGVSPAPPEWQERAIRLMQRLAISTPVRVCESAIAEVPSVIGWLRPVVLIPASALSGLSPEQLETILAHELAHVRRHDYLINLLQTAIETLLFYHPAVWSVGNRIRAERENCCDDLAVEVCGDAFVYARALADLEQLRHTGHRFALAATDGGLLRRISRVLGQRAERPAAGTRSYWLPALLMVLIATVGVVAQQRTKPSPFAVPTPPEAPAVEPAAPVPAPAPAARPEAAVPDPPPVADLEPPQAPEPPEPPASKEDFIETMNRAGFKGLSVDQLVALKIHGVTAEYIAQMKTMGITDINQIVGMRTQGVTPEYANEWKSRGWNLTPEQLMAFRIHGVSAQAIDQMKAAGFTLNADDAITMRIHGITPEFAKSWRDQGFTDIRFDQLVALRIHGASPALLQELHGMGFQKVGIDQLLQARIFGVTPAFVQEVRKHGFENLTFEQLVKLRQFDIIPAR